MDSSSMHNVLILLHAAAATIAFLAGALLIVSSAYTTNQAIFRTYLWALIGMAILLTGAILVYWDEYSSIERIVFPALLGLSLFMVFRGWGASLVLATRQENWELGYIEHIGFTLISLFEGFIIVSGIDAGFPWWLIALVAVLGLLVGRWSIARMKQRAA